MAEALDFDLVLEDPFPPHWPEAGEEEAAPHQRAYIYHPGGVHVFPARYITRDLHFPVVVRPNVWARTKNSHGRFTAALVLQGRALSLDSIVVLNNCAHEHNWLRGPGEEKIERRVIWCIRVSVIGGCTAFQHGFGDSFLWQIPSSVCSAILYKMQTMRTPIAEMLATQWSPTGHDFTLAEWPGMPKVTQMRDYYDLIFAMSVRPCVGALARTGENVSPVPARSRAPWPAAPAHPASWNLLPQDVASQIIGIAAVRSATTSLEGGWNTFLGLRLVCKEWKAEADGAAVARLKQGLNLVKRGILTSDMSDILAARDSILGAKVSALNLICDASQLDIYNLMRLRRSMVPTATPPRPPLHEVNRLLKAKKRRPSPERAKRRIKFFSGGSAVSGAR